MFRTALARLLVAAALAAVPSVADAQAPWTARSLGMGGAQLGVARGQDALFLNPANLALPDGPRWSLTFGQLGVGGTVFGPGVGDFARLFVDDGSDSEERLSDFFGLIPSSGLQVDVEMQAPALALQVGNFAFGISGGAMAQRNVSADLVDLFLFGYDTDRSDYRIDGSYGSHAVYQDYAVGYGHRFGRLNVGVTGHYLKGTSLSRFEITAPRYVHHDHGGWHDISIEADWREMFVESGSGYSLDAGVAMQPVANLTLSAAVSNLIGSLGWDSDVRVREYVLTEYDMGVDLLVAPPADAASRTRALTADEQVRTRSFYALGELPRTLRLGAAYAPWKGARVATAYHGKLNETTVGGWDRMASIGAQQNLWIAAVRGGIASDMDGATMLSAGASLGPLNVGLARALSEVDDHTRSSGMVTVGLTFQGARR
jgi:hypothetical protein